jgi:hypothetical protein
MGAGAQPGWFAVIVCGKRTWLKTLGCRPIMYMDRPTDSSISSISRYARNCRGNSRMRSKIRMAERYQVETTDEELTKKPALTLFCFADQTPNGAKVD